MAATAIHSSSAVPAQQAQKGAEASAKTQQQKLQAAQKSALPQDTVTLSSAARQAGAPQPTRNGIPAKTPSTGDVDHDGDSH